MKKILITGVSSGIGLALLQKFSKEGWYVIGTTKDGVSKMFDEDIISGMSEIKPLDLSSGESIRNLVRYLIGKKHALDIIVNNAGVLADEDETAVKIDLLRKTLEINLIGTIDLTEQLIALVNRGGHIVNISSTAGSLFDMDDISQSHYPYHYPAYKISKCALNMYTRTLALRMDHEDRDVHVSSVHPGWVRTKIGGDEASMGTDEAASNIFSLITQSVENGQFWFKNRKIPW